MKFKKDQSQQYLHNELNRHVPGVMKSQRSFFTPNEKGQQI